MSKSSSPAETRDVFGQNLRVLVSDFPSVSDVCRQLGVNRAQFNRYLNGESYPRPDTLKVICDFFQTDARILVEPLSAVRQRLPDLLTHPVISDYANPEMSLVPEDALPSGFYRFSRQSFLYPELVAINLLFIFRRDQYTFVKGLEARRSFIDQGLPLDIQSRTFKGFVQRMEDGFSSMITRRGGLTGTFNFFSPVVSINRNYWSGYAIRTVQEVPGTPRASRVAYEYLGQNTGEVLRTARLGGFCPIDDLLPFHQRLLKLEEPFA